MVDENYACWFEDSPTRDNCRLSCERRSNWLKQNWFSGWVTVLAMPNTRCPYQVLPAKESLW